MKKTFTIIILALFAIESISYTPSAGPVEREALRPLSTANKANFYNFWPLAFIRRMGHTPLICKEDSPVTVQLSNARIKNKYLLVKICRDAKGYYAVAVNNSGAEISNRFYFSSPVYLEREPQGNRFRMRDSKGGSVLVTDIDVGNFVYPEHALISVLDQREGKIIIDSGSIKNGAADIFVRRLSDLRVLQYIREGRAQSVASAEISFDDLLKGAIVSSILRYIIWYIDGVGYIITNPDNRFFDHIGLMPNGMAYQTREAALEAVAKWHNGIEHKQSDIAKLLSKRPLRILFVCTSNVNRSAAMHIITEGFILRNSLKDSITVVSHGTHMIPPSDIRRLQKFNEKIKALALEKGIDPHAVDGFSPQTFDKKLSAKDIQEADIIIAAQEFHRRIILDTAADAASKTFLFTELLSPGDDTHGRPLEDSLGEFDFIKATLEKRLFPLLTIKSSSAGEEGVRYPAAHRLPEPHSKIIRQINAAA
jgi:protein-tyrosine-phosphatase